ncbi:hypothetical protein H072_5513 [Dactylellina haptotyla CBS 200.50]|uniref:Rab-GAP TBC domain-containing protein n=1 Tax=Dactylellina haptotyla (strain CBS 200.50) TaxID=1284197 RepID=S8ACE5_DACHA|nr:hypothetical protein H072_5513 [Dactylellina haptotyla CBS 200.50]
MTQTPDPAIAIDSPAEKSQRSTHSSDSMVTVRLSNSEIVPSKRISLKLVTDDQTAGPRALTDPVIGISQPSPTSSIGPFQRDSPSPEPEENTVDWAELERSEEKEIRDDTADESTSFLLARLEKENSRIVNDPKAALPVTGQNRPPSLHHLKKLMDNPDSATLRYSMLPSPPPLTDLDFYAALVNDYHRTAVKLPFLLSKKIRSGIPPPLRGVVWMSISGSRDSSLEATYDRLQGESSPYEHLIGKDLDRTFPGVDIFSTAGGEGQRMLGRVLRAFSVYDTHIGYCQGLGFLVGPLLMHMGEREAFCVLVRLMENYELRSCFLPNMYGLQLRLYQLSNLIEIHLPDLAQHLDELGIQTEYATQWFLSFFAVTCPLPMLLRIYDVIFLEGAPETIMRVAISLLRRNKTKLLASNEFEEVMQMLLARGLWDTYKCSADDLVNDFTGLTGMVTREGLVELENKFKKENPEESHAPFQSAKPQENSVQAVASRFLGRFWTIQSPRESSPQINLGALPVPAASRPSSSNIVRRTTSKQSFATVNSLDGTGSELGSGTTETGNIMNVSDDVRGLSKSGGPYSARQKKDNDLHDQIEELIVAMSTLQRENAATVDELQTLRQEREEERRLSKKLVALVAEDVKDSSLNSAQIIEICNQLSLNFDETEDSSKPRQSYKELLEELERARERLTQEISKTKDLQAQLSDKDGEVNRLKGQVTESRSRWQDSQKERQRLEKSISELKARKDLPKHVTADFDFHEASQATEGEQTNGLRAFKLNRSNSNTTSGRSRQGPTSAPPTYNKRSSSLGIQPLLQSTDNQAPASPDALLLELVQAKTAEAMARQEAEEAKAKLEAMRKMLTGSTPPAKAPIERSNTVFMPGQTTTISSMGSPQQAPSTNSAASAFGRWAPWGRKSTSTD